MSYDLMVFEPEAAPKDHEGFLAWYREQAKWGEEHAYNDPEVTSPRLKSFFADINAEFPTLHGIFTEEELPKPIEFAAEYSIGKEIIYACFSWSKVDEAYRLVCDLAARHGLGFFNASSENSDVWLPSRGGLVLAHKKPAPSLLARLFKRKSQ